MSKIVVDAQERYPDFEINTVDTDVPWAEEVDQDFLNWCASICDAYEKVQEELSKIDDRIQKRYEAYWSDHQCTEKAYRKGYFGDTVQPCGGMVRNGGCNRLASHVDYVPPPPPPPPPTITVLSSDFSKLNEKDTNYLLNLWTSMNVTGELVTLPSGKKVKAADVDRWFEAASATGAQE